MLLSCICHQQHFFTLLHVIPLHREEKVFGLEHLEGLAAQGSYFYLLN